MPTLQITSTALPTSSKRAIAVRLTRWMAGRGIQIPHVVVRFTEEPRNSLFCGGVPIEADSAGTEGPRYATAVCTIGADRDERFRDELARELTDALNAVIRPAFVYIEFRPIDSALVYLALHGPARRATQLTRS
ncbi:MAG: hypothetical protein ABW215_15750 [Kibdelosporangium sp.]